MTEQRATAYDYIIIGGGFYGCCLALFLRSVSERVLLVEAEDQLMQRASRVNQARIHTGFHYPRSALTAMKSMLLHERFMNDFPEAVVDDASMLYAVARDRSKVSARRFFRMFRDMGAPIRIASSTEAALFNDRTVEGVFACREAAFDFSILRRQFHERLARSGVELRLATRVEALRERPGETVVALSDCSEVSARFVFNITYAKINAILDLAELPQAKLKYELAEIALIRPPEQLEGHAITLMDGPFFSCMPYPSEGLYSLTHVRYTPHESWTDADGFRTTHDQVMRQHPETRMLHMKLDGARFLPCLRDAEYVKSIFDVKTVLQKNEQDDGRPILYQQKPLTSRVISILGGKLDNIYDLFELVRSTGAEFAEANDRLVVNHGAPVRTP